MKRLAIITVQVGILIGLLFLALAWREYGSQPTSISVQDEKLYSPNQEGQTNPVASDAGGLLMPTWSPGIGGSRPSGGHEEPYDITPSTAANHLSTLAPAVDELAVSSSSSSEIPEETKSAFKVDHLEVDIDTTKYRAAIMDPEDSSFDRLSCPYPATARYDYLKHQQTSPTSPRPKPKYFFALDLHNCSSILPRLLGSVVETIDFLGIENCALSIVEGRSTDGTFEILNTIRKDFAPRGITYFFTTNDVNPVEEGGDRIRALADLRNQALLPMTKRPDDYDPDTTIVFLNDVALCMEDVLELIHQKTRQRADMTCAMDWIFGGWSFYDVWISRTMQGELFFEIPQSGSWDFAHELFWNNAGTKARLDAGKPYQAFSCWNGATAFTARPLLKHETQFRTNLPEECFLGEPLHFCKDLWYLGYGKIAVVPSVNIGYNDEESVKIKAEHGKVSDWTTGPRSGNAVSESIDWQALPPDLIKCVPSWDRPSWVPWDQALNRTMLQF